MVFLFLAVVSGEGSSSVRTVRVLVAVADLLFLVLDRSEWVSERRQITCCLRGDGVTSRDVTQCDLTCDCCDRDARTNEIFRARKIRTAVLSLLCHIPRLRLRLSSAHAHEHTRAHAQKEALGKWGWLAVKLSENAQGPSCEFKVLLPHSLKPKSYGSCIEPRGGEDETRFCL